MTNFRAALCAFVLGGRLVATALAAEPTTIPYHWQNAQIVGGGFVSGIVMHPTARNVVYARTDIGGAYRWNAGDNSWTPITDFITGDDWNLTGIESIALDPQNPDRVYLACGTYTNEWAKGTAAILRSSDRGKTWQRTNVPFKIGGNEEGRSNGERMAVDPNDSNVLLLGTRGAGLWRSVDAGATWSHVESFPAIATSKSTLTNPGQWARMNGIVNVTFDPRSGKHGTASRVVYACVSTPEASVYRSDDGGANWSTVANQPVGLKPHHAVLDSTGAMYITYSDKPGPNDIVDGAVYKLDTASGQWTNISPFKPGGDDKFGYAGVAIDAQHPGTLIVSTLDRWAKTDEIYRSTDAGKTWKPMRDKSVRDSSLAPWLRWGKSDAPIGHWIGDVEIDPFDSDHVMYVIGWGVWSTRDFTNVDKNQPTHWVASSRGIEECVVNDVISPPEGAHVLSAMWDIDGFRHDDLDHSPAAGFFTPSGGRDTDIEFAELKPSVMVRVCDFNDKINGGATSSDGGKTWTAFAAPAVAGKGDGTVAMSADGATIVWTPEGAAPYRSMDRGKSWIACSGLAEGARVVADRADAKRFYAFDLKEGKLFASKDGGATFIARPGSFPKGDCCLASMPGAAGTLWLATYEGLFQSTDGGATMAKIAGSPTASKIGFGKSADDSASPTIFIVGKMEGVYGFYRSIDAGKSWQRINDDTHQFGQINAITGDPRVFGRVYLGSANRGVIYGDVAAK